MIIEKIPNFKYFDLTTSNSLIKAVNIGLANLSSLTKFDSHEGESEYCFNFLFYDGNTMNEIPEDFFFENSIFGCPVDGILFLINTEKKGLIINKFLGSYSSPYSSRYDEMKLKENPFLKYVGGELGFDLTYSSGNFVDKQEPIATFYKPIETVSELVTTYSKLERKLFNLN